MGRPKLAIDEKQVEELAAINCSYPEMAAVLRCNESTLTRRFAQAIREGRQRGKASLKRVLWKKGVLDESVPMLIWLSKNYLGFADKIEEKSTQEITQKTEKVTDKDMKDLVQNDPALASIKAA